MLSETTAVRNAWAASERELQLRITINGQVFNAEDVTDFSYDSGAMNGESLTLGSTYANSIKITFSHIVENLKLQDKITPEIGIKLPDDTWNYTKLGVFIIDSEVKQDRNNGQTSLSATDNMIMLSGNYVPKIAYPAGVIEAITDIANQAGVKLNEANIARLTDTTIGALGKEATYRQAIGYVAQIAGGFAQFNRDGLLDIRGLEDPNFRITPDCYMSKGLTKNETFYRIGGMQAEVTTTQVENDGNENQETVTLQSGSPSGSQIKLTNPAMSQQLLDQLYDQYADINFYPYSLEWFADPNLEAGDWVTIVDNKGNEFKAPALGLTLSFNGGLSGTLKADTTVTSQTTFVYSGQFNQVVTRLHNDFATIAGNHIYKGIDQPIFAKKGDLWYQSVGPDTVMQVYQFDPDTGLYSWVEVGSTKPSRELSDQMDQVKKDITDQSTKIDGAVANANTAVSNSDLATKTATAAKQSAAEAVTVANQANLISSQAQASALSAKADANTAKANATQAINDATTAKGQASNALGQANTAINNAQDVLDKFNNMSVGGRNYFLNSGFSQDETNWNDPNGVWFISDEKCNGQKVMTATPTAAWTNGPTNSFNQTMSAITNQQVTVSVWAKASKSGAKFHSEPNGGYGAFDTSLTNTWKRYSYVAQTITVGTIHFMAVDVGTQYWISMPQVEIGNKVTDWSPAPEDVQIQIDNVNGELSQKVSQTTYNNLAGTVDTVSTLAKQNQSTIGTLATKTSVDTVNKTATTAQTLAQQNANELLNKASTNTVDTLTKRVTTAESTLSQTATKAELALTKTDVDKLGDTVNKQATQLALTATKAELQVAQTNVDNLKKTVTSNTAGMTANANALKLKADSSTVSTLDDRVTNLSGQLDVQSDLISAKVTASDVTGMLGNYATQSWSQGQISAAKNEIKASVETVKQTVDNSAVGTNLLTGTGDHIVTGTGAFTGGYLFNENTDDLLTLFKGLEGQIVTVSVDYKYSGFIAGSGQNRLGWETQIVAGTTTYPGAWYRPSNDSGSGRTSYTFVVPKNITSVGKSRGYILFSGSGTGTLSHFKLEKGSKATDWCLAPEDQATIDWTKSQLDITDEKITAGITTVTNTLNNNIASATANMATTTWTNTQIDAAKTAINLSVEQSITTSENTLNNNIANATKDMATQTWTKGQLSVTNDNVSASVQKLHDTVSGEITTATTDMATKSWTQGKLDLTDSQITAQISDVKDGLTTKFTTLQQTLSGVQVTANNAVTQDQLSLTATTLSNTISGINVGGRNLVQDTSFVRGIWKTAFGAPTNQSGVNLKFVIPTAGQAGLGASCVPLENGTYTLTALVRGHGPFQPYIMNDGVSNFNIYGGAKTPSPTIDSDTDFVKISVTFTLSGQDPAKQKSFAILTGSAANNWLEIKKNSLKLESGNMATDWTPAPEDQATVADVSSQFTQMQDDINLSVKTGDLISQINVESGETLIESASGKGVLNLSAATVNFSGEAFIPAASIKDLSADYIKTGTLDASKVNLISVNAASITAGIITGDNLSINLDSGEVLFQKGSIKSVATLSGGQLDIEIDDGTFTQSDSSGRGMRFQNGNIYLVTDVAEPFVGGSSRIADYGSLQYSSVIMFGKSGITLTGNQATTVATQSFMNNPLWTFGSNMLDAGRITGSAVALDDTNAAIISSKQISLKSGFAYQSSSNTKTSPWLGVGTKNKYRAGGMDWEHDTDFGPDIFMEASSVVFSATPGNTPITFALAGDARSGYALSMGIKNRTYSGAANMIITDNGVLGRVTSARKYKLLDHDAETVIDHAKRILDINPKQWFDKAEVETISQSLTNSTESQLMTDYKFQQYYGFIADDFHAAGLDEVVQFKNGEVDSLAYDRIPMYHNVILKDHETRIEKLERENKELKQQLAAIS